MWLKVKKKKQKQKRNKQTKNIEFPFSELIKFDMKISTREQ
jgi:hypothetical protein